jgi:putative peptide maturation dehydrogenase
MDREGSRTLADLVNKLGTPPPHYHPSLQGAAMLPLPRSDENEFDALLARRATCRNFDVDRQLPLQQFSHLLQRCFAAQGSYDAAPGATILKKHSPSGGGLHATEAYLLVQRVEGISPGLYHYHGGEHALARLEQPDTPLDALALKFLAGQHWFSPAHVLVVLVPRFTRSFWKYRNHAKAYRALVLDVGHLSQTLYLSATELGLGAFVTAAINEIDIERILGLDSAHEGPLAICGFGPRATSRSMVEFDPQGRVWPTSS